MKRTVGTSSSLPATRGRDANRCSPQYQCWLCDVYGDNGAVNSGETTLDCEYADSGTGEVHWDSNTSQPFAADGDAWARVSLLMADPRYVIPDLTGFTLNASAGIRRWGGTCGHTNGPLFDASPQISVSFPVCGMIDVLRIDERTWQGTCTTDSDHSHATVMARFEALP